MKKSLLFFITICCFGSNLFSQIEWTLPPTEDSLTTIQVGLILLDVDEVDAAKQQFTANLFFQARWKDPRLQHDGKGMMLQELNKIWHPQFQFVNQGRIFPTMDETVMISPEGGVIYRQRIWGFFSQPLNLKEFPMDQQEFEIILASPLNTPNQMQLISDPLLPSAISPKFSLPDWDVLEWEANSYVYRILPAGAGNAAFRFSIKAKRQIRYYFSKIMVPMFLVVGMSWAIFWIPPKQSETQITVAITSMLTLVAFRFIISDMLPRISYATRLDNFILFCSALVFLSIIQAVWTSKLVHQGMEEKGNMINRYCRWIFPSFFVIGCLVIFI